MRDAEAKYIRSLLEQISNGSLSPCVNLGSSSAEFRQTVNPQIHDHVIHPLEKRGVRVVNVDLKEGSGVDIIGDVFDPGTQDSIADCRPRIILCCNMFEHVEDRERLADILDVILAEGAYLLVTVPYSFPLHMDPIDTYYRPSPAQIVSMFPRFEHVESKVVSCGSYLKDILSSDTPREECLKLTKKILTLPYPFFPKGAWIIRHHRLLWLLRSYKVSCVLMRKKTKT